MTIYSGLDADAIDNSQLNPNDEITELLLQLKAPFRTTPDPSCASTCPPPPRPTGGTLPHCGPDPAKPFPTHWVHGRVPIWLKCSPATGITANVRLTPSGPILASGAEQNSLIHLRIKTRLLPTNHVSRPVVVYSNGQGSGSMYFKLKVDNTPPRLLYLRTSSTGRGRLVAFRVSEKSHLRDRGRRAELPALGRGRPAQADSRDASRQRPPRTADPARPGG